MAKRSKSMRAHIRASIDHMLESWGGRKAKKALILDGPMRSRKLMNHGLRHLRSRGPVRHYVRTNGTWFEGRANVRDYPKAIYWRRKHRPQGGECFQNARLYCLAHPEARYFEGFYLIGESPLAHGWVVMEDGRVLDFTHEAVIQKLKIDKEVVDIRPPLYLGVEVPHERLAELHAAVEENKPILDLYRKSLRKRKN